MWEQRAGDAPAVKVEDLKSVWRLFGDMQAIGPGKSKAAGEIIYKSVCSPGADVQAVWDRAGMLAAILEIRPELAAAWIQDGRPDDAVFEVAATFPMENMEPGMVREGFPLDMGEFVKRIARHI